MLPVVRGIIWAVVAFIIGALLTMLVRVAVGLPAWAFGPVFTVGYFFGFTGWLLGVGVWDTWLREYLGMEPRPYKAEGWRRYFGFNTDHKVIGIQYGVTFVIIFLLAGLLAMVMRFELMRPGRDILDFAEYNRIMSLHGFMMILVAVTAVPGMFGNYFVPLMIGAEDMTFPRMNALSYWIWPPAAFLLLLSPFFGGWDTGWTGYPPLAITNEDGQLLYNLAFFTGGLSSVVGSVNFLTTIITMRAPGMTWGRVPIFVWSMFLTSIMTLTATQFVGVAMIMNLLDRIAGTAFFNPIQGGVPLAYQHIFWFYSHPAVYVMILPSLGIMLEVLAHFSRKPLFAYRWAVAGMAGVTALSFTVWAHHMFTSGMSGALHVPFMATTEAISVPTGLIFLSALGTIWQGKMRFKTPMLFAMGMLFNFLIGGLTGVFNSDLPVDMHLHDTFWVVSHFHYTIMGGGIFGLFAGIYYWFPKMTGRMYDERLGRFHFWMMFVFFNLTFLPMAWLGINGMNRRIGDYPPQLGPVNGFVSMMAFFLGASFLIFIYNMVMAWVRGRVAEANPWGVRTLEWATSSPPPEHNFPHVPEVVAGPYDYGVPGGAAHARV
ncbi:MAG: cbb3-type cytochrome c oxidase subunit I [Ardenticatenia bacterium]|nr:cbb3-type cytochrome c oxidase subunit I [Ardenticatenia bacterium]